MLYFANRDIFCAGHVAEEDLQRVAAATGGTVQTCMNNFIDEVYMLKWLFLVYTISMDIGLDSKLYVLMSTIWQ